MRVDRRIPLDRVVFEFHPGMVLLSFSTPPPSPPAPIIPRFRPSLLSSPRSLDRIYSESHDVSVSLATSPFPRSTPPLQALPFVRCVGESWPMSLDRIFFESHALQFQHSAAPGLVPEVYHFDLSDGVLVMNYIAPPAIILRKGLIQGRVYRDLAEDISTFLARTLFMSSLLKLDTTEHKQQGEGLGGGGEAWV